MKYSLNPPKIDPNTIKSHSTPSVLNCEIISAITWEKPSTFGIGEFKNYWLQFLGIAYLVIYCISNN